MALLPIEDSPRGLSPGPFVDSPGSSVFDLPTHATGVAHLERRPSQLPERLLTLQPPAPSRRAKSPPKFIVLSGGTGGNAICSAFGEASYVLPVSDDGGSSSEIIRVLGGPSIGAYNISYTCLLKWMYAEAAGWTR
ncbi:hypothetical protein HWV62_38580 [Athelia sp. TMB]|nr:hypothetical protein HWV62_38580 [Athelia sp. TMB]